VSSVLISYNDRGSNSDLK